MSNYQKAIVIKADINIRCLKLPKSEKAIKKAGVLSAGRYQGLIALVKTFI